MAMITPKGRLSIFCGEHFQSPHTSCTTSCPFSLNADLLPPMNFTICEGHALIAMVQSILILIYLVLAAVNCVKVGSRFGNRTKIRKNVFVRSFFYRVAAFLVGCMGLLDLAIALWLLHLSQLSATPAHSWIPLTVEGIAWLFLSFTVAFGVRQQPFTFIRSWWVLTFLMGSYLTVLSEMKLVNGEHFSAESALVVVAWPMHCLLLFCAFKKEEGDSKGTHTKEYHPVNSNVSPFATASFFSRISFWWLNPLFSLGYRKPLEQTDLPGLSPADTAETTYDAFSRTWDAPKFQYPSENPSLCWVLTLCNWQNIVINGFYALIKTLMLSAGPLVLNRFIQFTRGNPSFKYEGYILVAALFLVKLLESLSQRQWYFGSRRTGMHLRSALIAAIYQKQLRLSNAGRQKHATGEIINYVSVDAYRIGEFSYWMHHLWATPLKILLALAILFYSVGWATIAGMLVIILTMLANSPIAKLQQKFQTQLMHAQDDRLRATMEALQNIKILKMQVWENHFKFVIESCRKVEYRWISAVQYRKTLNTLIFWISPVLIPTSTFLACYSLGTPLTPANVFTSLATVRLIQEPIRVVPDLITVVIQARVSLVRIAKFLAADELQPDAVDWDSTQPLQYAVKIEGASLSWDPHSLKPTLENINLQVKPGQRVAVCGEVGSGKSTLLYAVLGEVAKLSGTLKVSGSIAYVSQTAWIQSGTVRDNVLFDQPLDRKRYEEALRTCALDEDLKSFPFGDLTEIGERGLNMSGGQKQRIQLARAVYRNSDIYLLDDPFSAVDAHTATSLFRDCVMGALSDKTVILVTHQVEFLPTFDCILLMHSGQIQQAGHYNELLQPGSAFVELLNAHLETMGTKQVDGPNDFTGLSMIRFNSSKEHIGRKKIQEQTQHPTEQSVNEQLTKAEEKEIGDTGVKPYINYLSQNKGFSYCSLAVLSQLVFVIGQLCSKTWLAAKVDHQRTGAAKLLIVYASIGLISMLFLFFRSIFAVIMGLAASRSFFSALMSSVFHSPMAFFESTPTGRILSRVSSDLSTLDLDFPLMLVFSIGSTLNFLTTLGVTAAIIWQSLIVILPMVYLSWWLQRYYFATAKELMRFSGTAKSPIVNFCSESIWGAATIRAFKVQGDSMKKILCLIDQSSSPLFHTFSANEWVIQRLEALCATVICSSAMIMIRLPARTIDPGYVGLVLSYGLSMNVSLVQCVQNLCALANYSVSVERIKQYLHVPSEAPVVVEGSRPPPSWPSSGKVEFQNLQVRYRSKSPLILRGITCAIEGGQRIGVVGRTGSGKSTLISALFRLVEPTDGKIFIDGLNITSIGLHDLRSSLSIIPQEPTLFRGTVRFNLDPLSQYSDLEIWEVLEKCRLGSAIRERREKLEAPIGDDGANWSVGQRQLFCLGRALLKSGRILVLDEATASIDNATDCILQKTIREEFAGCTVITVAHRIPTVVDSDKVLALSEGVLVEFEEPMKLLERPTSLFANLVAEYWTHSQNAICKN